ncbi:MAG: MutT/Nudix family protein [Candidatus Pacebacteria bacterium GW2011_GWF2_38_9]|nr:MAG: mismatch repair protein MutT protein [candidate division TM6 bacterium GW2011_GWF2_28_16]KKQ88605.1 MAG: MutT/Nudix family protein [Candidatus Pacebacteria bacterium GW2011_GWF2_38_9]HAZ73487.1 hypothetical protein [Candidatus Paceibacterota bacterium]
MANNFSPTSSLPVKFIRPGIKAFIVRDGKILVVKEKVKRFGKETIIYDLPGGGIDPGENLHDALHREVMEEVGLKIEIGKSVGNWDFVIPSFEDPNFSVHIICMGYQCKLLGEQMIDIDKNPAKLEDIFGTVWMSKAEILALEYDVFAHNLNVRKALEAVEI